MSHTDDEVIEATGPREAIGRAVALLRAEHDVGEEDAFEMLVQGSADSSDRVLKVAATIVRHRPAHRAAGKRHPSRPRGPVLPPLGSAGGPSTRPPHSSDECLDEELATAHFLCTCRPERA
jgi:hypothetical protein